MINLANFLYFFVYFLVLTAVTLPIFLKIFKTNHISTWIFAKILGTLFYTYSLWLLIHIPFIKNSQNNQTLLLAGFLLISIYILLKNREQFVAYITINKIRILFLEVFFLTNSFLYVIYRGANSKVEGIEKFMDQALLSLLSKSQNLPPIDIWYAQEKMQYYYFGQFYYANIVKFLNTPFDIAYNIAISYSFALSVLACFLVLLLLVNTKYFALIGSYLVLLAGNMDYLIKVIIGGKKDYFFAEARGLVENAITEFPAYSFILGDLHAHFINIPFVLTFVAITIINFNKTTYLKSIVSGILLGVFFMINSWDYIVYALLTGTVFVYKALSQKEYKNNISNLLTIAIISIVTLLPFKLNFNAAVSGIGINNKFTNPQAFLAMFGHFLILGLVFYIIYFVYKKKLNINPIATLLFLFSILLVLLSEIFFIKDIYFTANPPYFRANTIFKFWYQAFILFGLVSIYFLVYLYKLKKVFAFISAFTFCLIMGFNISYTYNGFSYYFKNSSKNEQGLNGLKFMEFNNLKDEKEAIYFLNSNIKEQSIILEKPGDSYTTDSLFSTFTGNPTVVGWINHEFGWQGEWDPIAKTLVDIELIYTSSDTTQVKDLIKKYNITFVIIGNKEKAKYGIATGETLKTIGKEFYKNNSVVILQF